MSRVQDVINAMAGALYHPSIFYTSVDQLLFHYPELIYTEEMRGTTEIYHDLEKRVTPQGVKNSLSYAWKDLVPVMDKELIKMLEYRNAIVKILQVIKAARNKKLVLSVLEHMFKVTLSTGGGTSPMVRRIIMMYEREGNVKQNKRKTDSYSSDDSISDDLFEESSTVSEIIIVKQPRLTAPAVVNPFCPGNSLMPYFISSPQAPQYFDAVVRPLNVIELGAPVQQTTQFPAEDILAKKVKNLDYPVTAELIQDCQEVLSLFDIGTSDNNPISDDLIDDLALFDDDDLTALVF